MNKLENVKDISKDSILVTLDVKALYTNIPNHEDIEAVKETFNNQAKKPIATRIIINFLDLILMGTICVPAYANIFMEKFKKLHIPTLEFYRRYIFLMEWNGI